MLAQEAEAITRTYTHSLALTHAFDPLPAFTTYTDDFRCCLKQKIDALSYSVLFTKVIRCS